MKFFKHLRTDWFRYGFETLAVIVGILIALALENWNEERKLRDTEQNLLIELITNLETNVTNLKGDVSKQIRGKWCIDFIIEHLENRRPYIDSISFYLSEADYVPEAVLTSSAFETLRSTGLEMISSDTLRIEIIQLFEVTYPVLMQETKRLEDQLWPAVVNPLYTKHFRRTPNQAIPTDYESLLNDQEFLNMLSFRRVLRIGSTDLKQSVIQKTEDLMRLIESELK